MVRIAGYEVPDGKVAWVGLTAVYGIGPTLARGVLEKARIDPGTRIKDLDEDALARIRSIIEADVVTGGNLRERVQKDVQRLVDIGSYRGARRTRGLPVRGQRTRKNARSHKGSRPSAIRRKR
ncbi:30S ribosomal protein S13 [bacterium]|nr:30S ribosomal protein S13 [bacterium]